MKTQILSRIQSQQNIPLSNAPSLKRFYHKEANTLHTQAQEKIHKKSSYALMADQDPYQSKKNMKPDSKLPTKKKLFQSATTLQEDKKGESNNKRKQKLLEFNLNYKSLQKNRENKSYNMHKKFSVLKNEPGIKSQYSSSNLPNISTTHKKLLQKSNMNILKTVTSSAQKSIQLHNNNNTPDKKNQCSLKPMSHLMKTMTVFKDYKQSPYFAFTNKLQYKSGQKNRPIRSLYRISTEQLPQDKNQISIQIAQSKNQKAQIQSSKQIANQHFIFDCSQIKQKQMQNDSSFLSSTNRQFLKQISQTTLQKTQQKKKVWKKLPNDFLKY